MNTRLFLKSTFAIAMFFFCFPFLSLGGSPQSISYQAVVRNSSGNPITSQNVSFRIGLLQGTSTGTLVYEETHAATTNAFGLINLEIGNGSATNGTFNTIDWSNAPYFVKVALDETGGTNYVELGTSQLLSVPYALYAEKAATTNNADDADADPANELQTISLSNDSVRLSNGGGAVRFALDNLSDINIQQPNNGEILQFDGSKWINIQLCNIGEYYYGDRDADGLGDRFNPVFVLSGCAVPDGFVANDADCNDNDPAVGIIVWYADTDNDSYGDPANTTTGCTQPSGYVSNNLDCDDGNPNVTNCNDGNSCTIDQCVNVNGQNVCQHTSYVCNDGISCTVDVCDGQGGCVHTINPSSCLINGVCYSNGTVNSLNPCLVCNSSLSQTSWSYRTDGTVCGSGKICQSGTCVDQ